MTPSTFIHRGDLVNEINRLGTLYDIKDEMIDNPQIFMLCCSNLHEKCEARIVGLYSQKDRHFHIKRVDSIHTCSKNNKKETALFSEIQKYSNIKRTGELVEKISPKFKVSYYDVFKAQNKGNLTLEFFDKENLRNTGNMFLNELGYSAERDLMNFQKTEDLRLECHLSLKREIMELNNNLWCECNRNNFFVKNNQMGKVFRKITELKIYPRSTGTLVLGLLFDPCDEHVIQTFLVSEDSKIKALEAFIEYDKQTIPDTEQHHKSKECDSEQKTKQLKLQETGFENVEEFNEKISNSKNFNSFTPNVTVNESKYNSLFYIIDFDYEIIQFLISKNIPFFIKSRAVTLYIQDPKDEDSQAIDYFNILNNEDMNLLDIDKSHYLKKFCPMNLYNLNNIHYPDFDFITNNILSLSLIDCVNSLLWLISDDLKSKKIIGNEELENKFPETIASYFEEFNEILASDNLSNFNIENCHLDECYCECGKFQENLFPCIHAFYKIKQRNKDPFMYVSTIYSKDNYLKIQDIKPVVDVKVHPNRSKPGSKKKRNDQNDSEE